MFVWERVMNAKTQNRKTKGSWKFVFMNSIFAFGGKRKTETCCGKILLQHPPKVENEFFPSFLWQ